VRIRRLRRSARIRPHFLQSYIAAARLSLPTSWSYRDGPALSAPVAERAVKTTPHTRPRTAPPGLIISNSASEVCVCVCVCAEQSNEIKSFRSKRDQHSNNRQGITLKRRRPEPQYGISCSLSPTLHACMETRGLGEENARSCDKQVTLREGHDGECFRDSARLIRDGMKMTFLLHKAELWVLGCDNDGLAHNRAIVYGQSSSVLQPAFARVLSSNVYLNLRPLAGSLKSVCSTESGTMTTRRKFLRATGSWRSSVFEPSSRLLSS
jgi:hypothetical protein